MILAIIGLVGMGALLGFICGKSSDSHSDWGCPNLDYLKERKFSDLETRVLTLESENANLRFLWRSFEAKKRYFYEEYSAHCNTCAKTFHSKDQKGQEVADMLKNISLTSEEIAKKLDIKIV